MPFRAPTNTSAFFHSNYYKLLINTSNNSTPLWKLLCLYSRETEINMPVRKSSLPRLPSPPIIKENASIKQGIVTILRSDPEKTKSAPASIRRTLSADMSSKKWLELNGFFTPVKKIASFKELAVNHPDSSSESEEDDQIRLGRDDIWKSIEQVKEKNEIPKPNVWGSLFKSDNCKSDLPPPYVHPLVKRSASTLSEKSLEICTESLGSETGSDCFSPHPASELSDDEKEEGHKAFVQEETVKESDPFEDLQVKKYKVSPVRPFPPPIPSIAGGDGASLHMRSKRENGRLVLEAVSVPCRNYFHAQRQDGRLVLTLIINAPDEVVGDNKGEVFDNMEEVDEKIDETNNNGGYSDEKEEEKEKIIGTKNVVRELEFVKSRRSGMISMHKTRLVMKKHKNPVWTKKEVNTIVEDEGGLLEIPQSLPPPLPWVARLIPTPPSSSVGSFNGYDYFWRKNTSAGSFIAAPQSMQIKNNNNYNNKINGGNLDLVIIKEEEEKFSPYLRACKDGRRSLLVWEPYCIATS